jgi:hypothetical protein
MNWEAFNVQCMDQENGDYVYRVPSEIIEFCESTIVKLHACPFTCVIPKEFRFLELDVYANGVVDRRNWLLLNTGYHSLYVNCNMLSGGYGKLLLMNTTTHHIWIIYSNIKELISDMTKWIHVTSSFFGVSCATSLLNNERKLTSIPEAKSFGDVFQTVYDNYERIVWYREQIHRVAISNLQYRNSKSKSFLCWICQKYTGNA